MFSTIVYILQAMRPKQWIKNSILFIPLIFSGTFVYRENIYSIILLFGVVSCMIGASYIVNDIYDQEQDRHHPIKCKRPIAAGLLSVHSAWYGVGSIGLIGLCLLYILRGWTVLGLVILYLINTIAYSLYIKHIVIMDVFSIGIGFVLRGLIGAFAIHVLISEWLILILFFGALLLGFLKRYQEVKLGSVSSRKSLAYYNEQFLLQIVSMISTIVMVCYALYTFQSSQPKLMILTLPLVTFAIVRYYYNIFFLNKYKESIETILFSDNYLVWTGIVYIIVLVSVFVLEKLGF